MAKGCFFLFPCEAGLFGDVVEDGGRVGVLHDFTMQDKMYLAGGVVGDEHDRRVQEAIQDLAETLAGGHAVADLGFGRHVFSVQVDFSVGGWFDRFPFAAEDVGIGGNIFELKGNDGFELVREKFFERGAALFVGGLHVDDDISGDLVIEEGFWAIDAIGRDLENVLQDVFDVEAGVAGGGGDGIEDANGFGILSIENGSVGILGNAPSVGVEADGSPTGAERWDGG